MELKQKEIRLLREDEIECRVSLIKETGLSLLLYKDARVDQKILDEIFTPFGWKRSHQIMDGNLYCTVEVWDEDKKQWVGKQDVGTTSYAEKEKGQASDSFKRACFNWGIGRELYTAPFIWIPAKFAGIQRKENRYISNERFHVQSIAYDETRAICSLVIVNSKRQVVYVQNSADAEAKVKTGKSEKKSVEKGITKSQKRKLELELERTGVSLGMVLERYHLKKEDELTESIYEQAMKDLKVSKSLDAA